MIHIVLLFALSSIDVSCDPLEDFFQRATLNITSLYELVNMTKELKNHRLLAKHQSETKYIIIDEIKGAFDRFVKTKQTDGTEFEKAYYAKKSVDDLIKKCMNQQAISFYGDDDKTILREGSEGITFFPPWGYVGQETWEKAGTEEKEKLFAEYLKPIEKHQKWIDSMPDGKYEVYKQYLFANFNINNYCSSDEMDLCAFLSIGGPTKFYNDGARNNKGKITTENEITTQGFIVEAVGPRFSKNGYYDHLLYIQQDVEALLAKQVKMLYIIFGVGPGDIKGTTIEKWADMRGKPPHPIVNVYAELLKARYRMAYLSYLLYVVSETRKIERTKAYVSMTALGAGVWGINNEKQTILIVKVVRDIIDEFERINGIALNKYIDTVDFAWFSTGSRSPFMDPDDTQLQAIYKNINIVFSENAPSSKKASGLTVFELYPGNRNAAPGNSVYVMGSVNNPDKGNVAKLKKNYIDRPTGAQAAAFSSDIMVTQNPHINIQLKTKYTILKFDVYQSQEIRFGVAGRRIRRRVLADGNTRWLA